jgi:formylglycine-generating enzyme required for sulfatase activity
VRCSIALSRTKQINLTTIFLLAVSASSLLSGRSAVSEPGTCPEWNGLEFASVPGGKFWMGANYMSDSEAGLFESREKRIGGAFKDELPRHEVYVKPFCIMRDSLTKQQAERLLDRYRLSHQTDNDAGDEGEENITRITWAEAQLLATAISREIGKTVRLPTEAEWEYASRGGLANKHFPWGDISETYQDVPVRDIVLLSRQNCKIGAIAPMIKKGGALEKCVARAKQESDLIAVREVACFTNILTATVHQTPANGFGLRNLINNEWEWTSSRYMPYPYDAQDGREAPPKTNKEVRVVRGGNNNTETCLGYTALRGYGYAGTSEDYQSAFGVRFAMDN